MTYKKRSSAKRTDIHQTVTDKIVTALENGIEASDWKMPWTNRGYELGFPVNAVSRNLYTGVNVPVLWTFGALDGFSTNIWATYKQWRELDCQVKKGASAAPIIFYKTYEVGEDKRRDPDDTGQRMAIRHYSVFNLDQIEGDYEPPEVEPLPDLVTRLQEVDDFVAATGADIRHGGARAYYSQHKDGSNDHIQMPRHERFLETGTSTQTQNYYSVLLHELTHWTKNPRRLERPFPYKVSKQNYAAEELVAELGSAFLCATLRIEQQPREDHAQYLAGWLKLLKEDKKVFFTAAARAQAASDYLYGLQQQTLSEAA